MSYDTISALNNTTSISRDFKGIWIPKEIYLFPGLNAQEKILWSEIHSLYNEEAGGCFASNQYFCEFLGIKDRTLREMLQKLKKYNLITQLSFNGRTRVMQAIIPVAASQSGAGLTGGKAPVSAAEKRPPCTPSHINIITKNRNTSPASPPPSAEASELSDLLFEEIMKMKPDAQIPNREKWVREVDRMLRIDKRDPEKTKQLIKKIFKNDFWSSNILCPTSLRKNYDKLELKLREVGNSVEVNKKLAERISEKLPDWMNDFEICTDFVVFKTKGSPMTTSVRFDEKHFKTICKKQLEYKKVFIEGI